MMKNESGADDRRRTPRFQIRAPLTVALGDREVAGFTRDLSNRGVYFYVCAEERPEPGEEFEFVVELPPEITLSNSCLVRCIGRVARTELTPLNETGIAAEILEYRILNEQGSRARLTGA